MLNYFPVGPLEDQTYVVAHHVPGTAMRAVDIEHLNEQDAISEARKLNVQQLNQEKALEAERNLRLRGVTQ